MKVYFFPQLLLLLAFFLCTDFDMGLKPSVVPSSSADTDTQNIVNNAPNIDITLGVYIPASGDGLNTIGFEASKQMESFYPFFKHVHLMVFVGFGLLMCFLKTHCWSSVALNFLVSCWTLQLSLFVVPFMRMWIIDGDL